MTFESSERLLSQVRLMGQSPMKTLLIIGAKLFLATLLLMLGVILLIASARAKDPAIILESAPLFFLALLIVVMLAREGKVK